MNQGMLPYFTTLFLMGLGTMLFFSICFLFLEFVSGKVNNKIYDTIASVVIIIGATGYIFTQSTGSVFMAQLVLGMVTISVVLILSFIKLTMLDYSILFAVFLIADRIVMLNEYFFGRTLYILILFISIMGISFVRLKTIRGNIFNVWFAFMMATLEGYIFEHIFNSLRVASSSIHSAPTKIIVWLLTASGLIVINLGLVYALKKRFNQYFYEINQMGKGYPAIEKRFIYVSMGILLAIAMIHLVYMIKYGFTYQVSQLLTIFCMLALVIQLLYLTLLFRVAHLKENLFNKEMENQSLIIYGADLEENLNSIKSIKHDIKNIFFTMGQFVEQSDNEDMKLFYQSKIYPFASDEIRKNDLYGKLLAIHNEQFRAFLYYKIFQALKAGVEIDFYFDFKGNKQAVGMDFTDLIRVLGILLDNGIEECVSVENGMIDLKISQNNDVLSYIIKNNVSASTKQIGIKAGSSSKGIERGKGLTIVQNIIQKYDCVTLNSYFEQESFVQRLNIYREL